METKKFCLTEKQMPTQWYNIVADMPNKPLPPLHPRTKQPVTKEQMSAIFAEELIDQEMSTERYIDIPEEVQEIYRIWRPTPLVRATGLEKALGTPAKIFFKNESVSPAGSHKPNTAVPQAYYNYKQGITPPDDRDRRRTVGRFDRLRGQALRPRRAGFHGQGQLRPEALPPSDDEHVGRGVHGVAQHNHRLGPRGRERDPDCSGKPRAGDLGGRGDGSATPGRTPATAWAAC